MATILGKGSYGAVTVRDGKAVKKFSKLSHLIQEYIALQYLRECKYIVHSRGVDFSNLELHMELYDCSLRQWLENLANKNMAPTMDQISVITLHVLRGLVELHDRSLAHGDLKPGNILVKTNPLAAVIGDCGFVSIAKYAKVDRTAAVYRDPIVNHNSSHDMFSFGVCLLELITNIRITRQPTYEQLKHIIREKVDDEDYKKILYNLLHEDKDRRPTARQLLNKLFGENPPIWRKPLIPDMSDKASDERRYIRKLMKITSLELNINRPKKGYGALKTYLDKHNINSSQCRVYVAVTLMILSATFGKSGFRQLEAYKFCENKVSYEAIYRVLEDLLSDSLFLDILLAP